MTYRTYISGEDLLDGKTLPSTVVSSPISIPSLVSFLVPTSASAPLHPLVAWLPLERVDSEDFSSLALATVSETAGSSTYKLDVAFAQTSADGLGLTFKKTGNAAVTSTTQSASGLQSWEFKPSSTSPVETRADFLSAKATFALKTQVSGSGTQKMAMTGSWEVSDSYSSVDSNDTAGKTDDVTVSVLSGKKGSGTLKADGSLSTTLVTSVKQTGKNLSADSTPADKKEQGLALALDFTATTSIKGKLADYDHTKLKAAFDSGAGAAAIFSDAIQDEDFTASVTKEETKLTKATISDTRDLANTFSLSFTGTQSEDYLAGKGVTTLKAVKLQTNALQIETASFSQSYDLSEEGLAGGSTSPLIPLFVEMMGSGDEAASLEYAREDFRGQILSGANKITLLQMTNISAGAGNDTVTGSAGNDLISGMEGNDSILAGAGNDTIVAGQGSDKIDGGTGTDTLQLDGLSDSYLVSGTATSFVILDREAMTSTSVKNVEYVYMGEDSVSAADFVGGQDTITAQDVINLDGMREGNRSVTGFLSLFGEAANPVSESDEGGEGEGEGGAEGEGESSLWVPFASNLLDGALLERMNGQAWLGDGLAYNDKAAAHKQAFTSQDGAKLTWNDAATLSVTSSGGTLKHTGDFSYSGATKGETLAEKADKLNGKASLEESWTKPDSKGVHTETTKYAMSYTGVDGKGSASTTDDATFSLAMTSGFVAKITEKDTASSTVATATRKFDASYKEGTGSLLVTAALSFSDKHEMAYAGTEFPNDSSELTKDLTTGTLSKFSYEDKGSKVLVSLTGTETQNGLTGEGVSTLKAVSFNTSLFKSTTALVSYGFSYDEESVNRGLFDWLIGPESLDPTTGLTDDYLVALFSGGLEGEEGNPFAEAFWAASNAFTLLTATTIDAGAGNDTVTGSAGNDLIFGGSGVNILKGGAGNDLLFVETGSDSIDGGTGTDTVDLTTFGMGYWGDNYTVTGTAAKFVIKNWDTGTVTTIANAERILLDGGEEPINVSVADFLAEYATPTAQLGEEHQVSALDIIGEGDANPMRGVLPMLAAFADDLGGHDEEGYPEDDEGTEGGEGSGEAVSFEGFLPFAAEVGTVAGRMLERTWSEATQAYNPNLDSHKLTFTDPTGGAKLIWDDSRQLAVTNTTTTKTFTANFAYTGPSKIAAEKADALKGGFSEVITQTQRTAAGVKTWGDKITASYSGVEGNGTSTTSDDVKFSFKHSEETKVSDTLGGANSHSWTEDYSETNTGSYAGRGIKLDFVLSGKGSEAYQDVITEYGRETVQTKGASTSTLSKFAFSDTAQKLKMSFTATEKMDYLAETGSVTLKGIAIETAAFKASGKGFTQAMESEEDGVISALGDVLDQDMGDMSDAAQTLGTMLSLLMAGNDTVTLKALANPELVNTFAGNDKVTGSSGNDLVDGGAGNDTISGGTGNDTIYGGLGNDSLLGGSGDDEFIGIQGADTIDGGTNGAGGDVLDLATSGYILGYAAGYTVSGTATSFTFTDTQTGLKTVVKGIERVRIGGETLTTAQFLAAEPFVPEGNLSVEELVTTGNEEFNLLPLDMWLAMLEGGNVEDESDEDGGPWAPLAGVVDSAIITNQTWSDLAFFNPNHSSNTLNYTSDAGASLTVALSTNRPDVTLPDLVDANGVTGVGAMRAQFAEGEGGMGSFLTFEFLVDWSEDDGDHMGLWSLELDYEAGNVGYSLFIDAEELGTGAFFDETEQVSYATYREDVTTTVHYEDGAYAFDAEVFFLNYEDWEQSYGWETIEFRAFSFTDTAQGFSAEFTGNYSGYWDSSEGRSGTLELEGVTIVDAGVTTTTSSIVLSDETIAPNTGDDGPVSDLGAIFTSAGGGLEGAADVIRDTIAKLAAMGDNAILGSNSDDFIFASTGNDTITGGAGTDTLVLDSLFEEGMAPADFDAFFAYVSDISAPVDSVYLVTLDADDPEGVLPSAYWMLTSVENIQLGATTMSMSDFYTNWTSGLE